MTEEALLRLLRARFDPHTVLLYGSRARGDATPHSDWDVACVADVDEARQYGWLEDGAFLDVFVYPALGDPQPDDLRMLGSRVLLDERGVAQPFLRRVAELEVRGPTPMPAHQREMELTWIAKMVERARRGLDDPEDLEAHYRRHWLLKSLLEYAFTLRDRWFPGPRAAIAILRREDPAFCTLFEEALAPDASLVAVERLAAAVRQTPRSSPS
jgi:hypothetical protein